MREIFYSSSQYKIFVSQQKTTNQEVILMIVDNQSASTGSLSNSAAPCRRPNTLLSASYPSFPALVTPNLMNDEISSGLLSREADSQRNSPIKFVQSITNEPLISDTDVQITNNATTLGSLGLQNSKEPTNNFNATHLSLDSNALPNTLISRPHLFESFSSPPSREDSGVEMAELSAIEQTANTHVSASNLILPVSMASSIYGNLRREHLDEGDLMGNHSILNRNDVVNVDSLNNVSDENNDPNTGNRENNALDAVNSHVRRYRFFQRDQHHPAHQNNISTCLDFERKSSDLTCPLPYPPKPDKNNTSL